MDPNPVSDAVQANKPRDWLASLLLQQQRSWQSREIWTRFALNAQRLVALGRGQRRRLTRKAAVTVAGAALLLALGGAVLASPLAGTGTISVSTGARGIMNGDGCSLVEAIINANDDAVTHAECAAGSGDDTIVLDGDTYTYTADYAASGTALPAINSLITIEGNQAVIKRDDGAPEFRLFKVEAGAALALNDTTVSEGKSNIGGGIHSEGTLMLTSARVSYNQAEFGGGIFMSPGSTLISDNSDVRSNKASKSGGGIMAESATVNLSYSALKDNESGDAGGGLAANDSMVNLKSAGVNGNAAATEGGGLAFSYTSEVMLINSVVEFNYAAQQGGGIFAAKASNLTITESQVGSNSAGWGAGMMLTGNSTAELNGSLVDANNATSGGGGVLVVDKSTLTVVNSNIKNNQAMAGVGGGVLVQDARVEVNTTTVSGNASVGDGGGFYLKSSTLYLTETNIVANAGANGGGAYILDSSLFIYSSTFSENTVSASGGALSSVDSQLEVSNTTLSDNKAQTGGAIASGGFGLLEITSSTLVGNEAEEGGGLMNDTHGVVLWGSVVSGNTASVSGDEISQTLQASMVLPAYNVLGHAGNTTAGAFANFSGYSDNFYATSDEQNVALSNILNPSLAYNGAGQKTHALVMGSPAIDFAPSALCLIDPVWGIDERGEPRNVDGDGKPSDRECDSGAYEFNPGAATPTPTVTATPSATPSVTPSPTATTPPTPGGEKGYLPVVVRP